MSQFTTVLVNKNIDKNDVEEKLKFNHYYACLSGGEERFDSISDYNAYSIESNNFNKNIHLIGMLNQEEYLDFDSWADKTTSKEMDKLTKIKDFLTNPNYTNIKRQYTRKHNKLWARVESFTAHINELEMEAHDNILSRTDISDEEKARLSNIENEKILIMLNEIENSEEYQIALEEFQSFQRDNEAISDSELYTLKPKKKPKNTKFVPLTLARAIELSGGVSENPSTDDDAIYMDIDFGPSNIDDELEKAKNKVFIFELKEYFSSLKDSVAELLKITNEVCILTWWESDEDSEELTTNEKSIHLLSIEDILYLPNFTLLKIVV